MKAFSKKTLKRTADNARCILQRLVPFEELKFKSTENRGI